MSSYTRETQTSSDRVSESSGGSTLTFSEPLAWSRRIINTPRARVLDSPTACPSIPTSDELCRRSRPESTSYYGVAGAPSSSASPPFPLLESARSKEGSVERCERGERLPSSSCTTLISLFAPLLAIVLFE
ncbi:unnamed protein product [Linum trigynum]|uniref:Uncharacterized protein n=1 Tax=Linum trigynum TaxID=586398 RepID=A0AAV2CAN8_9ROSI